MAWYFQIGIAKGAGACRALDSNRVLRQQRLSLRVTQPHRELGTKRRRRFRVSAASAMLGDYLTALLVAVLGYIYPVYLCFKVSR